MHTGRPLRTMNARWKFLLPGALATALLLSGASAALAQSKGASTSPGNTDEIQRFCSNIADAARDRRYALQAEQLKVLRQGIDKRMKELETKRAEYEDWLKRRNAFAAMAQGDVVQIYSKMKPDGAAERLAAVKPELAAAILLKLNPRQASQILNEMDTRDAATLTGIMAAAARKVDPS
jgi:flagellar motility protein MotE (MotC chaperone)